MKKKSRFILIGLGLILIVIVVLFILFQSILYPYDSNITKSVENYLISREDSDLDGSLKPLKRIANDSVKVLEVNALVKEILVSDYNTFLWEDFDSSKEFEDEMKSRFMMIKEINEVSVGNKAGISIRLLADKDMEEVLALYNGTYQDLSRYYEALDAMNIEEYDRALKIILEIQSEEVSAKAFDLKNEISKKIVLELSKKALEHEQSSGKLQAVYEEILSDLKKANSSFNNKLSDDKSFLELVETYENKLSEVKANNASKYDPSLLKEITIDKLLKQIKGDHLTIVYLGRESCPHCKAFLPILNQTLSRCKSDIYYVDASKIDYKSNAYSEFKELANDYSRYYPTLVAFKDGDVVGGLIGNQKYNKVISFYESLGVLEDD